MPKVSPLVSGVKVCARCGILKTVDQFHCYRYTTTAGNAGIRAHSFCKACDKETRNTAGDTEALRRWRAANPDKVRQQRRAAQTRPSRRATKAKLQAMRKACMRARMPYKNCPKVAAIYAEARQRRESGEDVHVDHVIPLALGGEHRWENLQIIPAIDNMRKGAKPHFAITRDSNA